MAVVVGADDVNRGVELAQLKLVAVVGDVGRQVGGLAGSLDEHVGLGLVLAVREPDRVLAFLDESALGECLDCGGHRAVGVQPGFRKPTIEFDVERRQVGPDLGQGARDSPVGEPLNLFRFAQLGDVFRPPQSISAAQSAT